MTSVDEQFPEPEDFRALAENLPQLAWIARPDGWIFWYNRRWYEYTGTSPAEMAGWGWQSIHDPAALPLVLARWKSSLRHGEPFEMVFPLRGADGVFRPFLTRVQPIRDDGGRVLKWFGTNTDITEQHAVSEALAAEKRRLETLNRTADLVARELELEKLVQTVTDAGVALTGAQFGAFFYNVINERGENYTLYTVSGAPRSAFAKFPMPRNTAVFNPTFKGLGTVRSEDITQDERYGKNSPYKGMPEGHLPVRSYLAVPVISRVGEVLGGLFFGHPEPGVFTPRHEQLLVGIAGQASVGIDNARLFADAQREIQERRAAEKHRQLLINELNHRVKNTLATVQSIVAQTMRKSPTAVDVRSRLDARLVALSEVHDLLTRENWDGTTLRDVVNLALHPYRSEGQDRFTIEGPVVTLAPKTALAVAMALHELVTNAIKYGALSVPAGQVKIEWRVTSAGDEERFLFRWVEENGPPVPAPSHRGFGSRMIETALGVELSGTVQLHFRPTGLICEIDAPLPRLPRAEGQE